MLNLRQSRILLPPRIDLLLLVWLLLLLLVYQTSLWQLVCQMHCLQPVCQTCLQGWPLQQMELHRNSTALWASEMLMLLGSILQA